MTTTTDVLGRTVGEGDAVGGAMFGRYPATVWGRVIKVTPAGSVRVRVITGPGGYRPGPDDVVLIPDRRIFKLDLNGDEPTDLTGSDALAVLSIVWGWIEGANDGQGSDVGDLMQRLEDKGYGPDWTDGD